MILKVNLKKLIICLLIPLAVGGLSTLITSGDMKTYGDVIKPPLSPPAIVFPIVWTILYILMGISLYLVVNSDKEYEKKFTAIVIFAIQLLLNFIWSPVFFSARKYLIAFIILLVLLCAVILMTVKFYKIYKWAGLLQIPYIIWLLIASYLNLFVYILN